MSVSASRRVSTRGPEWDRIAMQVYLRDGAYRDAEGQLHKVCRNWTEAKKRGLPAPCPNHGEDEVWACHGFGWSTHTPLRLVPDGIVSLCSHCDPDRNPAMRPSWWGSPKKPVKAGWERESGDRWELVGLALLAVSVVLFVIAFKAHSHRPAWLEVAVPVLAVSAPLWWVKRRLLIASILCGHILWMALLAANIAARHSSLRPWTFGSPSSFGGFLGLIVVLLALWGACVILVHAALRRRWLSRGGRALLHTLVRLARWVKP